MLSIVVLEFLGTGLVLPFNVVYLHEVRDFTLSDVGLLLALPPLMGLLVVGPGGSAIDRVGARRIQLGVLTLLIAGNLLLAFATTRPVAALALSLNGIAFGMSWPAWQSVVASVIPQQLRQRYFGVNFTLLNLGIGIGGVLGGLFVDVADTLTFQVIYLADAVSYVPALLLLLGPLRHVAGRVVVESEDDAPPAGYLAVFRSPAMATMTLLSFISSFVGYSQLNVGMPAYARGVGEVSTRALGFAFAANTLVIVLLQLVVLQRIEGRRRTRVIAVMGVVWAFSWVLLGLSGLVPGTAGATLLVAACAAVFAFGETLLQPTVPAVYNDLASDHNRGRYNAINSAAFQGGAITGPIAAGLLLANGLEAWYIAVMVIGCLGIGVLALALERRIPASANGVPTAESVEG